MRRGGRMTQDEAVNKAIRQLKNLDLDRGEDRNLKEVEGVMVAFIEDAGFLGVIESYNKARKRIRKHAESNS